MWALEDSDDIVARHEAGHAVASLARRDHIGPVEFVDDDSDHVARADTWNLEPPLVTASGAVVQRQHYSDADLQAYEDAIVISMAGPAAEAKAADRSFEEAMEHNPGDRRKADVISHSVWRQHDLVDQVLERLGREAQDLVESHWDDIERIATALEEQRRLEGDEVRRLATATHTRSAARAQERSSPSDSSKKCTKRPATARPGREH
jgi:hypothetical protein